MLCNYAAQIVQSCTFSNVKMTWLAKRMSKTAIFVLCQCLHLVVIGNALGKGEKSSSPKPARVTSPGTDIKKSARHVVIPRYVPSHFDGCLLSSPAKNCVVILEAVICEGPKLAPLPGIRETHASMVTFLVMVMLSMVCGWISQCSALVLSMYLH